MKNILSFVFFAFSFILGGYAFAETGNAVTATLVTFSASYVGSVIAPFQTNLTGVFCTLAHFRKAQCGKPNPGGVYKLYVAPKDQFAAPWGHTATAGIIQTAPTFKAGFAGWVEIEVTGKTAKADNVLKGVNGFQNWDGTLELKTAGNTPEQTAAIESFVNTELVCVIELNDLQRKNIGTTIFPVTLEGTHSTGAAGSDENGWTLSLKTEGAPSPSYFIKEDIAILVQGTTMPEGEE